MLSKKQKRLSDLLDRAVDGPLPMMLVGIADGANGKIEVIARMAYIAGIKRALEIVREEEVRDDAQAKDS